MRLNKFVARATGFSRRAADKLADAGEILINGHPVRPGQEVTQADQVTYAGKTLQLTEAKTIMLNKPVGYICSRDGQGGRTIYDILPPEYQSLKPIGRLDKNSSGLLLLTNDGDLAQKLTHPKYQKEKVYEIALDKPLKPSDRQKIEQGIKVEDYVSKLSLKGAGQNWTVTMTQGKNRQIRKTFATLNYTVTKLHRTKFGEFTLNNLANGYSRELC